MKILAAFLLLTCSAFAQRIVYTKVFPGSQPAYVKIAIAKSGEATYQEDANESEPAKFQVDADAVTELWRLAAKLDYFKVKVESGMKVARTGDKTFRWEDGATNSQATYNYTTNEDARSLNDWFERIIDTQRLLSDLQMSYRFDRLGVNEVLVRLEDAWAKRRLVAPDQFVSLLDRIHANESILNLARERAANLADAFRRTK